MNKTYRVLAYWRSYTFDHEMPPTVRQAASDLHCSAGSIYHHLRKLVLSGEMTHVQHSAHAYRARKENP